MEQTIPYYIIIPNNRSKDNPAYFMKLLWYWYQNRRILQAKKIIDESHFFEHWYENYIKQLGNQIQQRIQKKNTSSTNKVYLKYKGATKI